MVERHEFPQVGQVTCSIGFTAVDPRLAPTDILGQADEALYYAKEHGRNQVCCYESLVEHGLLVPHEIQPQQPEIDIDALFA
jgi:predicted signal transduction protein with EAL and GGDEF domain